MRQVPSAYLLVLLVAASFALRIGYVQSTRGLGRSPERKYREYVVAAGRLIEYGQLETSLLLDERDGRPASLMPPLYTGLVAVLYWFLGTESFAATLLLHVLNAAAGAAAVWSVFLVGTRLGGQRAGWLAALIASVNPLMFGYTAYIWDTSLFIFATALTLWLVLRLSDRPIRMRAYFGFGLYLGIVAMLNPALTAAYPLLVVWMLARSYGWSIRRMAGGAAVVVCGWLVAITPWTIRNYLVSGELMYVRSGLMMDVWLGVCPEAETAPNRVFNEQYPHDNAGKAGRVLENGEYAFVRACKDKAVAAIKADPLRWMRLCLDRAVDFWAGTIITHVPRSASGWPASWSRAVLTIFLMAEVLVIPIALVVRRRLPSPVLWLGAIAIAFCIVYCATHVMVRYRAPIEPVMAVLVAIAVAGTPAHPLRRVTTENATLGSAGT